MLILTVLACTEGPLTTLEDDPIFTLEPGIPLTVALDLSVEFEPGTACEDARASYVYHRWSAEDVDQVVYTTEDGETDSLSSSWNPLGGSAPMEAEGEICTHHMQVVFESPGEERLQGTYEAYVNWWGRGNPEVLAGALTVTALAPE